MQNPRDSCFLPSPFHRWDNPIIHNRLWWREDKKHPFTLSQTIYSNNSWRRIFISSSTVKQLNYLPSRLIKSRRRFFILWRREGSVRVLPSHFCIVCQEVACWWQEWMQLYVFYRFFKRFWNLLKKIATFLLFCPFFFASRIIEEIASCLTGYCNW